ncbi:AraC family transcriptional regulator [Pseudomaricurvus alkylphenolicus]|uniref:AraC family transcriptional regulator n=1 Tax=Pseudomaricurvus alkylphenolicus TaxID=1306991 RepID=UPI0030B87C33
MYTHSLTLVRKVTDTLGVSFEDLLARADIDLGLFNAEDTTIPSDRYYRFLDEIVRQTGNQDFGLLSGRVAYIEGFHLYMYLASICNTVKEWINTVPSASNFLGDLLLTQVRLTADHFILEVHFNENSRSARRLVTDHVLSSTAALMDGCSVLPIRPARVDLTYPQPDHTRALNDVFRAPLHFNQPVSALFYDRGILDQTLLHVSTNVYGGVKEELDVFLSDSSWGADAFSVNLYTAIRRQLPSGNCSVNSVAKQLNISSRTLQRRLKERDTSFQHFFQEVKSKLAIRYLENENLNVLDISLLLGYGGPTAFTAAFKSWFGTTPSDYRRRTELPR